MTTHHHEETTTMRVPPSPDATTPTDRTPEPVRDINLRSRESLTVAASALRGASSMADDDDTAQWLETLAQQFDDEAASTPPTPEPATGATMGAIDLDAVEEWANDATRDTVLARFVKPWTTLALVAEVRSLRVLCIPLTDLSQELDMARQNLHHARAMSAAHFERAQRATSRAEAAEDALARVTREAEALRAQVAAVEAERREYPHADTCGSMLTVGAGYPCSCWKSGIRDALATTGEGK